MGNEDWKREVIVGFERIRVRGDEKRGLEDD